MSTNEGQNAPDPILTEHDVAKRLKCSPRTIKRKRVDGDGPAFFRVGRAVRYRLVDVEAWEAGSTLRNTSDVPLSERVPPIKGRGYKGS